MKVRQGLDPHRAEKGGRNSLMSGSSTKEKLMEGKPSRFVLRLQNRPTTECRVPRGTFKGTSDGVGYQALAPITPTPPPTIAPLRAAAPTPQRPPWLA